MIENQAVILVLNMFDIFFEHELCHVEFSVGQSEEIFELDWYFMIRNSKHVIAVYKFLNLLQSLVEGQMTYIFSKMN